MVLMLLVMFVKVHYKIHAIDDYILLTLRSSKHITIVRDICKESNMASNR